MKNDRKPYILKGLLCAFILFLILIYIFNSHCHFCILFTGIIISFFFSILISNTIIRSLARSQNKRYLQRFQPIPELGAYQETLETAHTNEKKYDHFVLILHGFTASPHEMLSLIETLKQQNIPFLAPMLIGFGLTDSHLLEKVTPADFYRTALLHFDLLEKISHKVSVIGHSIGAVLATYIAQKRSVHRLILTAPAFYFFPQDKQIIRLLTTPILSNFILMLIPYLPKSVRKTSGQKSIQNRFHYLSVPTQAIKNMLLVKQSVNILKINPTELFIFYGAADRVVNIKPLLKRLDKHHMAYQSVALPDKSHNIFEESENEKICQLIVDALKQ